MKNDLKKGVQKFSKEYVTWSRKLTATQRAQFAEDFKLLAYSGRATSKSKLISLKVPEDLLSLFRKLCEAEGVAYQTQIKKLMRNWSLKL